MSVHETDWQPLVSRAIAAHLGVRPEYIHPEVQMMEGSIIDLVMMHQRSVLGFELKMADPGEVLRSLTARDLRQLRHFRMSCDALYLVTVASPTSWSFDVGGGVVSAVPPMEAQLLPEGVGWMVYEVLSRQIHTLVPSHPLDPQPDCRRSLVEAVRDRIGRVDRQAKLCLV